MITYTTEGIYTSTLLESIPTVVHGFTTKKQGDLGDIENARNFFKSIDISVSIVTFQKQIHSSDIHIVKYSDIGTVIPMTDGLLYKNTDTSTSIILVVRVADCVPILLIDPKTSIIGVAHSGWRGTLGHITVNLINTAIERGAHNDTLRVIIGPSICGNCYAVDNYRAMQFAHEFTNVVSTKKGSSYVNLRKAIYDDVLHMGILPSHIDLDSNQCTYEQGDKFFSYRRKNEQFGEIIGYIGYIYT